MKEKNVKSYDFGDNLATIKHVFLLCLSKPFTKFPPTFIITEIEIVVAK